MYALLCTTYPKFKLRVLALYNFELMDKDVYLLLAIKMHVMKMQKRCNTSA